MHQIKGVNKVTTPADNHFIRVRVTNLASRDMTVLRTLHPSLSVGRESLYALCRFRHSVIIVLGHVRGTGRAPSFVPYISTQHATIVKEAV